MFNLGMGEITVILLLALIFIGPKKLPELASGLGKLIREFRKTTSDVKNEIALDDTFRKPFEELRDAVTLHPDELKRRDEIKRSLEDVRKRAEELEAAAAAQAAEQETPLPVSPAVDAALAAVEGPASEAAPAESAVSPEPGAPPPAMHAPPPAPPPRISPFEVKVPPAPPPRAVPAEVSVPAAPPPRAAAPPPPPPRAATPSELPVTPPSAPPSGTVAAPPTRFGPPRVTPPISSLSGENANKTQSLSEDDLLPVARPGRRSTPPPMPGASTSAPPPLPGMRPPPPPPDPKQDPKQDSKKQS